LDREANDNPGLTDPKLLLVCRLNAKRPRGFPAGAIPTVDFLLAHPATIVKKVGVKTHDRSHSKNFSRPDRFTRGPDRPESFLVGRL